jgi:hypothetical protein
MAGFPEAYKDAPGGGAPFDSLSGVVDQASEAGQWKDIAMSRTASEGLRTSARLVAPR